MTDTCPTLATLRRPRLLIRAARFGLADYRRGRDLKRLIGVGPLPVPAAALAALAEAERRQEEKRMAGAADYTVARHVELLIALMAETLAQEVGAQEVGAQEVGARKAPAA
ncbi:MAG: DUF6477 family protein [Gemmobacter sp.]